MPPNSQQRTAHQAHFSGVPRDPDRLSDKQLPEVAHRAAMPILRAVWVSKLGEPLSGLPLPPSQQTSSVLVGLPRGVPHKTPAGMATLRGGSTRDMTKGTGHSPGPLGEFSTLQMPLVIWKCCKELRARLSQAGPTISAMPQTPTLVNFTTEWQSWQLFVNSGAPVSRGLGGGTPSSRQCWLSD